MYHYSRKYGVPPYKLTRWLHKFETIMVDGYCKPWIIDNDANRKFAMSLIFSTKSTRPKLPRLTIDEFMTKYNVSAKELKVRWNSLIKEESNGTMLIADTATNRKHIADLRWNSMARKKNALVLISGISNGTSDI